jgi:outer membrane protein OmpA-like peptidoglycan-associated protein/tetratricopeptide (TPR) repeat protein
VLIFISLFSALSAQKSPQEIHADKCYERLAYKKAVKLYNEADRISVAGLRKLAESYLKLGDFSNAELYFTKFMKEGEFNEEDIYSYAMALRSMGKYVESEKWLKEYGERFPTDQRVKDFVKNGKAIFAAMKEEGRFKIVNLDFNSAEQDFGPAFFGDNIVYSSSLRVGVEPIKRSYSWNEKPFLDLFAAEVNDDGQFIGHKTLNEIQKRSINKKFHEGPACFGDNGNLMAYTANNYSGKSRNGEIKLQIFFCELVDGVWQKEVPFKYNNSEYSVAHPWLSKDGKTMYYVSDMPGGYGGTDIYRIEKKSDEEWGDPINMGEKINTEGNEMFPFVEEKNGYMFFSSDGYLGLGGLDVFMAVMKDYAIGKVINMGANLNSRFDDFALIVDENLKKGYFSSNREGGKGNDDIYYFEILKPFRFTKNISGKISDNKSKLLEAVKVELFDANNVLVADAYTDENGTYNFVVDADERSYYVKAEKEKFEAGRGELFSIASLDIEEFTANLSLERVPEFKLVCQVSNKTDNEPISGVKVSILYLDKNSNEINETQWDGTFSKMLQGFKRNQALRLEIKFEKNGYQTKTLSYSNLLSKDGEYIIKETLEPIIVEKFEAGIDIAKVINLKPIYFESASAILNDESALILDQIVKVLNENPEMIIEINAHTDCRGGYNSNMALSDSRAKSCATYISSRITNPTRISGKGFGETKLINNCSCEGNEEVKCSEEEHSQNRRTEFIVIAK